MRRSFVNRSILTFNELKEINNYLLEKGIRRSLSEIIVSQLPEIKNNNIIYHTIVRFITKESKEKQLCIESKHKFDVTLLHKQLERCFI